MIRELEFRCRYEPKDTVTFVNFPEFIRGRGAELYVMTEVEGEVGEAKLSRQDVIELRNFLNQWLEGTK